jgi:carbonic anhydrase
MENEQLTILLDGNVRFEKNEPRPKNYRQARRLTAKEQHPIAVVLTCSDSRLSPELIFAQTLGDLFVIRTAGEVVGPFEKGSIEYAVEHLHVKLIVVMGHEDCGAVSAAVEDSHEPGDIATIVEAIKPVPHNIELAVRLHAKKVADQLLSSIIINEKVEAQELQIVVARYDLDTGKVSIL